MVSLCRGFHLPPPSYSLVERSALSYPKGLWNVGATTIPRSHCRLYSCCAPPYVQFCCIDEPMQNKRHTFPRTIVKIIQITICEHYFLTGNEHTTFKVQTY